MRYYNTSGWFQCSLLITNIKLYAIKRHASKTEKSSRIDIFVTRNHLFCTYAKFFEKLIFFSFSENFAYALYEWFSYCARSFHNVERDFSEFSELLQTVSKQHFPKWLPKVVFHWKYSNFHNDQIRAEFENMFSQLGF